MKVSISFAHSCGPNPLPIANKLMIRTPVALFGMFVILWIASAGWAQTTNRITQAVDMERMRVLPNHLPQWASALGGSPDRTKGGAQFLNCRL